jgi:uncharacterized membrane protein
MFRFMVLLALCAIATARTGDTPAYPTDVRPLLAKYCFQCHGEGKGKPKGKIDLAAFKEEAEFPGHRKLWQQAREALDGHEMPPDDEEQPTEAERARIVAWIDAMRFRPRADGVLEHDAGSAAVAAAAQSTAVL